MIIQVREGTVVSVLEAGSGYRVEKRQGLYAELKAVLGAGAAFSFN